MRRRAFSFPRSPVAETKEERDTEMSGRQNEIDEVDGDGTQDGLTPKQERALGAVISHPTLKEAALAAGVSEPTLWRYRRDAEFALRLADRPRDARVLAGALATAGPAGRPAGGGRGARRCAVSRGRTITAKAFKTFQNFSPAGTDGRR